MRIALLAPAEFEPEDGGSRYNSAMVAALRAIRQDIAHISLAGRFPMPDECAVAGMNGALAALGPDVIPLVDSLALAAIPVPQPTARIAALIHHVLPLAAEQGAVARGRLLERWREMLPRIARVVATSKHVATRLRQEFGVPEERLRLVPAGAPNVPRSKGSGGCEILCLGTLVPRRRQDELLRACARLPDLPWSLTIAGHAGRNPVWARKLAELVDELGIASRVRFVTSFAPPTLERLWESADIFASAARGESEAVLREALRRGLPMALAAEDVGVIPPRAGAVCAAGDSETLSKGLRRLIFDRALRQDCAEASWRAGRALPGWEEQARRLVAALG